ncbi:hypothetical protein [Niveibacterium sp. SC-1]|uniref:hypothetical protein n=1 Tax=Niveibacterium sp. SC-1 TaxID=3135646 RepID=UPI00311E3CA4
MQRAIAIEQDSNRLLALRVQLWISLNHAHRKTLYLAPSPDPIPYPTPDIEENGVALLLSEPRARLPFDQLLYADILRTLGWRTGPWKDIPRLVSAIQSQALISAEQATKRLDDIVQLAIARCLREDESDYGRQIYEAARDGVQLPFVLAGEKPSPPSPWQSSVMRKKKACASCAHWSGLRLPDDTHVRFEGLDQVAHCNSDHPNEFPERRAMSKCRHWAALEQ